MNENERKEKMLSLATRILDLSRDRLLGELSFLASALTKYKPKEFTPELRELVSGKLASDYEFLCFEPSKIISTYKNDEKSLTRAYLHMVLHGLFQHMFVPVGAQRVCWDLACDVAVEAVIHELNLHCTKTGIENVGDFMDCIYLCIEENKATADALYRYYMDNNVTPREMADQRAAVYADDHSLWYLSEQERKMLLGGGSEESKEDARGQWEKIALKTEAEYMAYCANNKYGHSSDCLTQNVKKVNREKYDYTKFLKQFAAPYEAIKVNMDEFDYIYYAYGTELYGNVPLIEPLEYKEDKKIRDFVIAIDTSGSVEGDLVQKFVQKTYNILKSTDSFSKTVNVYIIQCDAKIKNVTKLTSLEGIEEFINNMTLEGFGGTDFRPVFEYVDNLIDNGELSNLEGIIYFTDAYGEFPPQPSYKAAFVFVDEEFNKNIPSWAIKLILSKEELAEL